MNLSRLKLPAALLFFVFMALLAVAQPGGHPGGFPGGRPPMGPPPNGRPGDRPGNRGDDSGNQTVRQKKITTAGSTFKVVGMLRDSVSNEVLSFVNVAALNAADSSFVRGAASDLNGSFSVTELPAGKYLLRISFVGYQNRYVPFTVENNTALGTLKLKPGAHTLAAVTITAEKPIYAMEGEKMIYNVTEDPSIQTGTTSDALQNAPGVEVDIEGNVTLRGVSSVEIWINDKPSNLTAENLKTYLETPPANALDRIETITNPSAKYATTAEAVINIVTTAHIKKNHFISFGLNGASQPSLSPWLSYMWANEKLSFNIYASGRYNYSENTSNGWMVKKNTSFDTVEYDTNSSLSESNRYSGNIFLNFNYTIDSMTELSAWMNASYGISNSYSYSSALRNESYTGGAIYTYVDTNEIAGGRNLWGVFGGDYTHKYDNEGHNLRISAFGNFSSNNSTSRFVRSYNGTTLYTDPLDYQKYKVSDDGGTSLNLDARYNPPSSKDGEMSYGLGYEIERNNTLFTPSYRLANGTDSVDLLRQYSLVDVSNSINGDVNWTHRWGGFTLELGMGADWTHMDFAYTADGSNIYNFLTDAKTLNFLTYTPSIHTSYRTESMHNFKLNYTLRMRNPSSNDLTSRRTYDEDSYYVGNPNLKSSLTHSAEIGWTKFFSRFGNVGIEGYASYSTDEISSLTDATDGVDPYLLRSIQYTTPYNMGSSYQYGTSLNMTYRPNGFFNLRFYGNLYNSGYEMNYEKLGKTISDNMTSYSLRVNCWTKIMKNYQIHASASYRSPTQSLYMERKARYSLDCGVRADFFKRKLSAFINVQDIFNWGKTIGGGSTNTNPYLLSSTNSYVVNSRYISAGITLRFGKMELEKNSKSGGEDTESAN